MQTDPNSGQILYFLSVVWLELDPSAKVQGLMGQEL